MKLLRSPWVTGVLVVLAVGVVFYQVIRPQLGRMLGPSSSPAPAPAPPAAGTKPASPPPAVSGATAVTHSRTLVEDETSRAVPVDVADVREKYKNWVDAPGRDPFLLVRPVQVVHEVATSAPDAPSPILNWTLQGILSQTGGRAAAINNRIYREGEFIVEGYRLQKIESGQVWISGSNGLERLTLLMRTTNSAPQKPVK